MVDYAHPVLLGFIRALRAGEPWLAFLDWLQEQGATLADVLRLYAQPPKQGCDSCVPDENGIVTDFGCDCAEHPPASDDSLSELVACWEERVAGRPERAKAWREWKVHNFRMTTPPQLNNVWVVANALRIYDPLMHSESSARRELKRRKLGLYDGEVMVPFPCGPDPSVLGGVLWSASKPSDLIPPEPRRGITPTGPAMLSINGGPEMEVERWDVVDEGRNEPE